MEVGWWYVAAAAATPSVQSRSLAESQSVRLCLVMPGEHSRDLAIGDGDRPVSAGGLRCEAETALSGI
jgi:hypothetical protein